MCQAAGEMVAVKSATRLACCVLLRPDRCEFGRASGLLQLDRDDGRTHARTHERRVVGLLEVARSSVVIGRARGEAEVQADASVGKVAEGGIAVAVSEVLGKGASVANEHIVVEGDFEKGTSRRGARASIWRSPRGTKGLILGRPS